MNNLNESQLLNAFEVEELEARFEMAKWIEFVPCECDETDPEPTTDTGGDGGN